jgi:DNA-binding CsgD family transcriptional regulator
MMLTQSSSLHSFISTLERQNPQPRQPDNILLQGVIESFFDGILILTEQGELVQANDLARQICEQLTQGKSQRNPVPQEIWRVCQALIESRSLYDNQPVIIESEITTDKLTPLRIRTRWLKLSAIKYPCLLVILEDRYQSVQNLVIAEVDKYGLTPREAEVWLLRRAKYALKEIATELSISLNTVKKHIKNIHAKREIVLYMEEE